MTCTCIVHTALVQLEAANNATCKFTTKDPILFALAHTINCHLKLN